MMTAAEIADKLVAAGGDTASLSPAEQEAIMRTLRTWDEMLGALMIADKAINPPDLNGIAMYKWRKRLDDATKHIRAAIAKANTP